MNEQEALARMIDVEYGKLTVKKFVGRVHNKNSVLCKCKCGKLKIVAIQYIVNGKVKTCGGSKCKNSLRENHHGMSGTITYNSWKSMVDRCTVVNSKDYYKYGAIGITVCKRWLEFKNFLNDMGERPSKNHTLDRYPNNCGNYEKGNVRWALPKEQASNRKRAILVKIPGGVLPLVDVCKILGVGYTTAHYRIRNGKGINESLTIGRVSHART